MFTRILQGFYQETRVLGGPGRSWEVLGSPRTSWMASYEGYWKTSCKGRNISFVTVFWWASRRSLTVGSFSKCDCETDDKCTGKGPPRIFIVFPMIVTRILRRK